ncbi:MAG: transposase [Deltaproteobacteria bacterium]|nr:transposase [Deltaproteobacteria bacterium]
MLMCNHLQGTELETAQVGSLRVKLLKIGARIRETGRRIWISYLGPTPGHSINTHHEEDPRADGSPYFTGTGSGNFHVPSRITFRGR